MARTPGALNADHDEKRQEMAEAIARTLISTGWEESSLRGLSRATGLSVNNLRHYFGDRDGAIVAAMAVIESWGAPHMAAALSLVERPPGEGLRLFFRQLAGAWTPHSLQASHGGGLAAGLGSETLGPAYVDHVLEPTLQLIEALLTRWIARGALQAGDARVMALSLSAPVILALLHQRDLHGRRCRPLDVDAFIDAHVDGWLTGYGPTSPRKG
ncbi:MAG: TetR/AcrR family transcriptional regulator [Alphaproteobacteria bacterium]|nr:TetR/AcrR family transcriptional regulator [Alphaproteobacteria bacterium]